MKSTMVLAMALTFVQLGCSRRPDVLTAVTSSVPATEVTRPLAGRWGADGEASLIISLDGDRVVISAPENETWRMEIHDAKIVDDSVHFVQKNYLHSGDFHPFSGVACNCIARLVDGDKLELGITTVQSPKLESDILSRLE